MFFDSTEPYNDNSKFVSEDWPDSDYIECKEELPPMLHNQMELNLLW